MERLALAVLLLSLELVGRATFSSADAVLNGRASLVGGVAAPSEFESGVANGSTCPKGSSWGSCGGSSQAGSTYAMTAHNWSQTPGTRLTAGVASNVTLTPCPSGIDYTTGLYDVYIADGANSESVLVHGGSSGSGNCAISFTPYFSHTTYTLGSASSGIQETINVACGTSPDSSSWKNAQCNVTIPANGPFDGSSINAYNVYGTIFFHSNQSILGGYGATLRCQGRGPCIQIGSAAPSTRFNANVIQGLSFRSPTDLTSVPAFCGSAITASSYSSNIATVTTKTTHGFRPGDLVTILFTDNRAYWGDALVQTVPTSTTFTFAKSHGTIASQTTPGVVALAYEAILDGGLGTHFQDIQYDVAFESGHFNNFFDFWDDENALIEHFNNNGIPLNNNANWTGSFIFSGGNPIGPGQWAPVITLRDSSITANYSNGATVYNSNGLYIENTVIQASGLWQVYSSNSTGNYQGAYLKNIYSESSAALNPLSPPSSPFPGLGIAGLIAGPTAVGSFQIAGNGGTLGAFQTGGTGSTPYTYFIVANDRTAKTQTSPMQVLNWLSSGSDSIPVRWPRVANGTDTITYDVIRMATPNGIEGPYPYDGGCSGGTAGMCGSVAVDISQATACAGDLVCRFIDYTGAGPATSTSPYAIQTGNYAGNLIFWPGSIVSVNHTVSVDEEEGKVVGVGLSGNPLQIANQCLNYGTASPGGYTTCLASVTTANNAVKSQTATLMSDGGASGGGQTPTKGRLNFTTSPFSSLQAHHIITLIDSQPSLTRSTQTYRPPASKNDTWIGTDVSSAVGLGSGQLAFGAPVSITNYIDETGDGVHTNWLERLTSKQKTFAVPVRISEGSSFTLGDGSPLSQMKIYSVHNIPASHVPPQSCVDVLGEAKGITTSDHFTSVTPPGRLGNLSLNAYAADEGKIILHFCNISNSEATTPPGAYSFLAVR
jgi:hypothetical protein